MPSSNRDKRTLPPAARVFGGLQADDAFMPSGVSTARRSGALFLALLVLAAVPLYLAANAAGLLGDVPAAVAKSSNSGPGGGDDDDNSGPGGGDDDDDDSTGRSVNTDDTSANGNSTRGTTNDNDTNTRLGTNDTSGNNSTQGTTNDNDTRTDTGTHTRTGASNDDTGQTHTNTGS